MSLLSAAWGQVHIAGESGAVFDAASGKLLWSKNLNEHLYPASTTKIMTALLLIEHCAPDDQIVAPSDVEDVRGSSMHLMPGEAVSAREMLYAILLRSANDGCYASAMHIAGSVPAFADLMNERAQELGCTHTHFNNPNGLPDPLHYTTAHDLGLIARAAMQYPVFRETVRTVRHEIVRSMNQKDLLMINRDKLLVKDPTMDGIKTGWTDSAGHCFVGSAVRNGYRVITVVMKTGNWQTDTDAMMNWAFATHKQVLEATAGDQVGQVPVVGGEQNQVAVAPNANLYDCERKGENTACQGHLILSSQATAPIAKGQQLGEWEAVDSDGFTQRIPVFALAAVPKLPEKPSSTASFAVIGAAMAGGAVVLRSRARKLGIRAAKL